MTPTGDQQPQPGEASPPQSPEAVPPQPQPTVAPWMLNRAPTPPPLPPHPPVPVEPTAWTGPPFPPGGSPGDPSESQPIWVAEAEPEPEPEQRRQRRKLPRVPWRRFAVAGVVLAALGLLGGGFALGWTTHAALGSTPDGNTKVTVAAAPNGAAKLNTPLPDVRGLSAVDARQAIADAGLAAGSITTLDAPSAQAAGTVVSQDPIGGTTSANAVKLYVAVPGRVPALIGKTADDADRALTGLGVRVQRKQVYDPAIAEGTVTALDPPAGSALPLEVTVTVSGPASSLFLDALTPIEGGCSTGKTSINGKPYEHAVYCSPSSYSSDDQVTTYLLNRLASSVEGVVGVADQSDPGLTVAVSIVGDGRTLYAGTLRYGQSVPFVARTRGVLRLEIHYRATSQNSSGQIAFGDVHAVGAPADIVTLGKK